MPNTFAEIIIANGLTRASDALEGMKRAPDPEALRPLLEQPGGIALYGATLYGYNNAAENNLCDYLVHTLPGLGFELAARDWPVRAGHDYEGRGDLVFTWARQVDLVVEVKFVDLQSAGRNSCVKRTKKRRQVVEQAVKYALAWYDKVGLERDVIAAFYTNKHGLVELFWLGKRGPFGFAEARLRFQRWDGEGCISQGDKDTIMASLTNAGIFTITS